MSASKPIVLNSSAPKPHATIPTYRTAFSLTGVIASFLLLQLTAGCDSVASPSGVKATALIRISPAGKRILFSSEKSATLPSYDTFINTEAVILRSPAQLQRVLDLSDVQATEWYQRQTGSKVKALQNIVTASHLPGTELIEVQVAGIAPSEAVVIVNTIAAEYKKLADEKSKASDTSLYQTLTREMSRLQAEIIGQIETKYNISSTLGTTAPEELRTQYTLQLSALEAQKSQLLREFKMLEWKESKAPTSEPADDEAPQKLSPQLEKARKELELFDNDIVQLTRTMTQVNEIAHEIARYEEQIIQKRELRDAIRKRLEVIEMEGKSPMRVHVVSSALDPDLDSMSNTATAKSK